MRVLLVSDNYPPNRDGVATSVASLAAGLHEAGHDVAVLAPRAGTPMPAERHATYLAPSFATGQGGYRFGWLSPKALARVVQHHKPDVVHIHTLGSLGLQAAKHCRRSGLKCVLTWHTDLLAYREAYPVLKLGIPVIYANSLLPHNVPGTAKTLGRTALATLAGDNITPHYRQMLSSVAAPFERIIVPSEKTASAVLEMVPTCAPCVIPSAAVRHGPLDRPSMRRLQAMQQLMHHGESVIAYVGRISSEKNVETLLRTLAREVLPAVPDAKLNIIGDGRRAAYERLVRALGITHAVAFTGPAPPEHVGHLLGSCGVLAHPSLTETQGLVIAEAALAGVPAVVLDTQLEGVVRNGHTGYVADSVDGFGAALIHLLERPDIRKELGVNAQNLAFEYTSAQYASRVIDVYDEITGSR
ncbi:glycosyl transferase [Actinomadura cremea]|nr:glycosyl transferase [Actinomadura cremea]